MPARAYIGASGYNYPHWGERPHGSDYPDGELMEWAAKMRAWLKKGRGVYAYFNNDAQGFAAHNALSLQGILTRKG